MITKVSLVFVSEMEIQHLNQTKTCSMFFDKTGTVMMVTKIGNHEEYAENFSSQAKFAEAHPTKAAEVAKWLREYHGGQEIQTKDILTITFPEKHDMVPITKLCTRCHKTKHVLEFPQSPLSPDGVHDECCECRKRECTAKKFRCTANKSPDGKPNYERYIRCRDCQVGI